MKRVAVMLILLAIVLVQPLYSQTTCVTIGGEPGALTPELLDQAAKLSAQKDLIALQRLMDAGLVFELRDGVSAYLEETKGFLEAKVRLRMPGQLRGVWTYYRSARCK